MERPKVWFLVTEQSSNDMPPLPSGCPNCDGGIVVTRNLPNGDASGRCAVGCGWFFTREGVGQ